MEKSSKIYVAASNGMVGSAIVRKLKSEGFNNVVLRSSKELDLRKQSDVENFFASQKPEYVFLAAAKVGGILANSTYPAQFLHDNLLIQNNVIHQSHINGVTKLLFLGSSCIYPKMAPQPLKEEYLLSGYLESTNEPYAIAKIAGIKMCEYYRTEYGSNFISAMPTNLYGPQDNFDLYSSHVMAALIRKFSDAKFKNEKFVDVWGTGSPLREFMHVDDLASACIFLMRQYNDPAFVNVGTGKEITIKGLAELIKETVQFKGELRWDTSKPDGTPRKIMDSSKILTLGWSPQIQFSDGIRDTCLYYQREVMQK